MDRSQKSEAVAQLNAVFNDVGVVVVTRNLGLTVDQSTDLRGKMREAGATYKVAKNRLAKLALKDTDYTGLEEYLTGPVGSGLVGRPGRSCQSCGRIRQDERQARNRRWLDGHAGARRSRRAGTCLDAKPRRTARHDCWSRQCTGDENRPRCQRTGCQAGPCLRCLWQPKKRRKRRFFEFETKQYGTKLSRPNGVKHHGRYCQAC